jgi:hypothetical protein
MTVQPWRGRSERRRASQSEPKRQATVLRPGAKFEAYPVQLIVSCGGFAPSRDESETAVVLVVKRPKL